jgi:putative flippase GtrA
VIETPELQYKDQAMAEDLSPLQRNQAELNISQYHNKRRSLLFRQAPRFILVGGLNTALDLLALNCLLLLFPTTNTSLILLYTVLAYSVGAANSFLLNKYWTFEYAQRTTPREIARFTITTLFGIGWNATLIWLASKIAHPFLTNTVVWTNASKLVAIGSAAFISFLGLRLWVFVNASHGRQD